MHCSTSHFCSESVYRITTKAPRLVYGTVRYTKYLLASMQWISHRPRVVTRDGKMFVDVAAGSPGKRMRLQLHCCKRMNKFVLPQARAKWIAFIPMHAQGCNESQRVVRNSTVRVSSRATNATKCTLSEYSTPSWWHAVYDEKFAELLFEVRMSELRDCHSVQHPVLPVSAR